jgi:hypothetical protein
MRLLWETLAFFGGPKYLAVRAGSRDGLERLIFCVFGSGGSACQCLVTSLL